MAPRLDVQGPRPGVAPAAHLVLGYRDDDAGGAALQVGADLTERLTATLHVVHVVDLSDYPIDPDDPDWDRRAGEHLAEEQRQVDAALAGSRCSWTYHAAHGDPVDLLRRVADDHDALMFVVGTRGEGLGGVVSRLLGVPSVSHGLIARSHRPVVVCHSSGSTHTGSA
ncbi:universal stress protein [Actinomycetospora soli]|uniref:universal stress protein n=1 Tax=Actinomycetospora soli TaxID=2893887 RepID=UPI001E3E81C1|nr:universal stress protein [Actinomycetospora soli]MCD2191078.1 universal stress protein [Actinomycetospora soli]